MEIPLCVFVVAAHCSAGWAVFGQGIEMRGRPWRSLRSSRETDAPVQEQSLYNRATGGRRNCAGGKGPTGGVDLLPDGRSGESGGDAKERVLIPLSPPVAFLLL
jgi:hypothetical protein